MEGFAFPLLTNPNKAIFWNPDTASSGHLYLTGTTGAGKTRLAKELIKFLHKNHKNTFVFDVQNTLGINDQEYPEKVFEFKMRNSPYSINPFEFLLDEDGGGPISQIDEIMEMFRKTFMSRLKSAPMMSAVLRRLIVDTYKKAGIIDDDISTWGIGLSKKEHADRLPIIADMKELIDYILDVISGGYGAKFSGIVASNGKKLNKLHNEMSLLKEDYKKLSEIETSNDEDGEKQKKELLRIQTEIDKISSRIDKDEEKLVKYFRELLQFQFRDGAVPAYESLSDDEEASKFAWLDYKYYTDRKRLDTINTIKTYVETLNEAGVFGKNVPMPSFAEINRYNLKPLKDEARIFCSDVLVSKLFRMIYLRGEYKSLPEGTTPYHTRRPGTKTDTAILIDEIQTLLPSVKADFESQNMLYNKIISQIRNFGGMLIYMSQSPANFPALFHTNTSTKIILYTDPSDIPSVKASTGIKDNTLFQHLETKNSNGDHCVALMKDRAGVWQSVKLPWADI